MLFLCVFVFLMVGACRSSDGESPRREGPLGATGRSAWRPVSNAVDAVDAVYDREIGTAHPVMLVATAGNGRWVVACEARDLTAEDADAAVPSDVHVREALVPFLFRGGGAGRPIGELVAVSSDDRWLAIYRDHKLVLLDDARGLETTLDPGPIEPTYGPYRQVAAFDSDSTHLIYFRVENRTTIVTIRELSTQRERDVTIPNQRVGRVVPEPVGHWARVLFAGDDEDEVARRYGPFLSEWRSRHTGPVCEALITPFMFALHKRQAWLDLDSGELRHDPDVLTHLGDLVITKAPDNALHVGDAVLVPAACDADVMAVSARPVRVVAVCAGPAPVAAVELFGPGFRKQITPPVQREMDMSVRFVDRPYVCPTRSTCVAIDDGSPLSLQGGGYVAVGANVLVTNSDGAFFTVGSQGMVRLPGARGRAGVWRGAIRTIDTTIIDLAESRVLGEVERRPIAVDLTGRALISARTVNYRFEWDVGPLRWVTPQPATAP